MLNEYRYIYCIRWDLNFASFQWLSGSAREVAAACAHEAVKGYVMKVGTALYETSVQF